MLWYHIVRSGPESELPDDEGEEPVRDGVTRVKLGVDPRPTTSVDTPKDDAEPVPVLVAAVASHDMVMTSLVESGPELQ
jgi:hypothetical protein